MKFTVHTMEYAGGRAEASLDLRNYQDSDYEEYRIMYNGCFLACLLYTSDAADEL